MGLNIPEKDWEELIWLKFKCSAWLIDNINSIMSFTYSIYLFVYFIIIFNTQWISFFYIYWICHQNNNNNVIYNEIVNNNVTSKNKKKSHNIGSKNGYYIKLKFFKQLFKFNKCLYFLNLIFRG